MYSNSQTAAAIAAMVYKHRDLFSDQGTTVDILEEECIPINLKQGAEAKAAKVYPLG